MLKRLITGIVYIGIIVGFFFLRHVHTSLFGILVYAFSIIGTLEMIQAFAHKSAQPDGSLAPKVAMTNAQKSAVMTYAVFFAPAYYTVNHLSPGEGYRAMLVLSFVLGIILLCLLVVDRKTTLEGVGASLLCGFYPTAILATMLLTNDLGQGSTLALLLIFTISPIADSFAFVVGSLVKGKKLCPSISPNKTISGAIGGVVFGTGGCLLIYWLYTLTTSYVYAGFGNPWVMFTIVGIICSVMTEFGDLVESVLKRRIGIKDMGKILPGHGGILDRIDGTLFASTFIYIVFVLFIL